MDSDNLQMLNAGLAKLDRNWNWNDIGSPFTRIYCVTQGCAWIIINNRKTELRPGHLYIIPAFTQHSYECDGPFEHFYLHIYEKQRCGDSIFDRYELPTEIRATTTDIELFEAICRRNPDSTLPAFNPEVYDNSSSLADFARRFDALGEAEKMFIRGAVMILLSRFIDQSRYRNPKPDNRLQAVMNYIDAHLDSAIELDCLAAEAGMSKAYLIRLFRQSFDMTPLAYVNKRRMEKAQLLLITTDMPVKEIAYTLGFADCSYFNRLFKKQTGRTPQSYRVRS